MVRLSPKTPVKAVIRDETAARALATPYTNNTGRPLLVQVTCDCRRVAVVGAEAEFYGWVGTPFIVQAAAGLINLGGADTSLEEIKGFLSFAVPPGQNYRVTSTVSGAGSYVNLTKWIEVEL